MLLKCIQAKQDTSDPPKAKRCKRVEQHFQRRKVPSERILFAVTLASRTTR